MKINSTYIFLNTITLFLFLSCSNKSHEIDENLKNYIVNNLVDDPSGFEITNRELKKTHKFNFDRYSNEYHKNVYTFLTIQKSDFTYSEYNYINKLLNEEFLNRLYTILKTYKSINIELDEFLFYIKLSSQKSKILKYPKDAFDLNNENYEKKTFKLSGGYMILRGDVIRSLLEIMNFEIKRKIPKPPKNITNKDWTPPSDASEVKNTKETVISDEQSTQVKPWEQFEYNSNIFSNSEIESFYKSDLNEIITLFIKKKHEISGINIIKIKDALITKYPVFQNEKISIKKVSENENITLYEYYITTRQKIDGNLKLVKYHAFINKDLMVVKIEQI